MMNLTRKWLDAIARHFMDMEWLRERRKQEIHALRSTPPHGRPSREGTPFERDFFPRPHTRTTERRKQC